MLQFFLRRCLQSIVLILAMSIVVFAAVYAVGNPIDVLIPPEATQAEYEAIVRQFGLDLPLYEQFWHFAANALKGDLGTSFVHGKPAVEVFLERMPATLELALLTILVALIIGIPLGMIAGLNAHNALGKGIMAYSVLGFSLPSFWIAIVLVLIFAVHLGWFPAMGRGETDSLFGIEFSFLTLDGLAHLALPVLTMSLYKMSIIVRLTRCEVLEVMQQDFIKYAFAKGLTKTRIIFVHVLKNIMIPILTVIGLEFANILAFAVVTETVFALPGMGKLLIDSILNVDRPVVVAYLMMVALIFITINFIVDICYAILDPRIRLNGVRT